MKDLDRTGGRTSADLAVDGDAHTRLPLGDLDPDLFQERVHPSAHNRLGGAGHLDVQKRSVEVVAVLVAVIWKTHEVSVANADVDDAHAVGHGVCLGGTAGDLALDQPCKTDSGLRRAGQAVRPGPNWAQHVHVGARPVHATLEGDRNQSGGGEAESDEQCNPLAPRCL